MTDARVTNREAEIEARPFFSEFRLRRLARQVMSTEEAQEAVEDIVALAAELRVVRQETETLREALREATDWYRSHLNSEGFYDEEMWGDPFAISPHLRAALASPVPGDET